jgi:hypothetical protein
LNGYQAFRTVFIIIGVFMIIFGTYYTYSQFSMLTRSERITATVVDINWVTTTDKNGKTVTYGYPVYEWLDPGGSGVIFRGISRGGGGSTPQVGDKVAIIYDPADSAYVYEDTLMGIWAPSIIPIFTGLVFILFFSGFPGFVVDAIRRARTGKD